MHALFVIGRILFVLIFILSGAAKLMDISGTAAMISAAFTVPSALADIAAQIERATGLSTPQLLAILSGVVELGGGLLIAFNVGTRAAALILILFTAVATYYFHDFWNMTGDAQAANIPHAEKNLSLIGGLLILFVLGPWRPVAAKTVDPYE
jgi:putative oxidoreductase